MKNFLPVTEEEKINISGGSVVGVAIVCAAIGFVVGCTHGCTAGKKEGGEND